MAQPLQKGIKKNTRNEKLSKIYNKIKTNLVEKKEPKKSLNILIENNNNNNINEYNSLPPKNENENEVGYMLRLLREKASCILFCFDPKSKTIYAETSKWNLSENAPDYTAYFDNEQKINPLSLTGYCIHVHHIISKTLLERNLIPVEDFKNLSSNVGPLRTVRETEAITTECECIVTEMIVSSFNRSSTNEMMNALIGTFNYYYELLKHDEENDNLEVFFMSCDFQNPSELASMSYYRKELMKYLKNQVDHIYLLDSSNLE